MMLVCREFLEESGMAQSCARDGASEGKFAAIIFGQDQDPHVTEVAMRLRAAGLGVVIVDQYRHQMSVSFAEAGSGGIWPLVDWAASFEGVAIWQRVKAPLGDVRPEWAHLKAGADDPAGPYQTAHFFRAEWHMLRLSMEQRLARLPNVAVINRGTLGRFAVCKPLQLEVASSIGFTIPRTVIGNEEKVIAEGFGDELLYKPLSGEVAAGIGLPPPAMLAKADVLAEGRASIAPGIFQDRVQKKFELRVTVAGQQIVAVRIDSQAVRFAQLDWRRAQHRSEIFEIAALSADREEQVRRYMAEFELDYGAFDFAVDLDDRLVFFECNPEGQWLWMEPAVGPCITDAVAAMIIEAAHRAGRKSAESPRQCFEPT